MHAFEPDTTALMIGARPIRTKQLGALSGCISKAATCLGACLPRVAVAR